MLNTSVLQLLLLLISTVAQETTAGKQHQRDSSWSPLRGNKERRTRRFYDSKPKDPSPFSILEPDPSLLQWESPAKAGGQTCGFLNVPLSYRPENLEEGTTPRAKAGFPSLKVKFCAWFANTQPAPKGTIFFHCGGPSSTSNCDLTPSFSLYGSGFEDNFNRITVDQRGIGQSLPSFAPCDKTRMQLGLAKWEEVGSINFTVSDENDQKFRQVISTMAQANADCWKLPEYQFMGPPEDGFPEGQDLHFLLNSGTQALINDINVFRMAIGAEKLSLNGGSYGTAVVGAFATTFPDFVDKFVSNSPISPFADSPAWAEQRAKGPQMQYNYQLGVCQRDPSCPLSPYISPTKDLSTLINDIQGALSPPKNVSFPPVEGYKARIDELSSSNSCDDNCKYIYSLFDADLGEQQTAIGFAIERAIACRDRLGENIVDWEEDLECLRLLDDVAQGAVAVTAAALAGTAELCSVPETGGFFTDFVEELSLQRYVPFAKAMNDDVSDPVSEACRESIFTKKSMALIENAIEAAAIDLTRRRSQATNTPSSKCLDSAVLPTNVMPCTDLCVNEDFFGLMPSICLSDLNHLQPDGTLLPVTEVNWVSLPTVTCEESFFILINASGDFLGFALIELLPEDLQQSLKSQGICNMGGGSAVNSQDRANHMQQLEAAIQELHKLQNTFSTQSALDNWMFVFMLDYGWPLPNPVPTMGAPNLNGIVIASLYDPNTLYTWGQEMKGQFPTTSMITTGFVTHVLGPSGGNQGGFFDDAERYAKPCFKNVHDYVMGDGELEQPQDGLFCPAPEPTRVKSATWFTTLIDYIERHYTEAFYTLGN